MNLDQETQTVESIVNTNGVGYTVQIITPWGDLVATKCPDLCFAINRLVSEKLIELQAEIREDRNKNGIASNYLKEHFLIHSHEHMQAESLPVGLGRTSEPTEGGMS